MSVKSKSEKTLKISELSKIPEIKNISSQKDKRNNITILFQTKQFPSKEIINYLIKNKDYHNIEEIIT